MTSGVYKITNAKTGRWYVGSGDLGGRRRTHLSQLRRGCHANRHLQAAFDKDGEEAFEFELWLPCSQDIRQLVEQEVLDWYYGGSDLYNVSAKAGGGNLGARWARSHAEAMKRPDVREKMSIAHKGRKHSAEWCANISAAKRGQSNSLKGTKFTPEHCQRISAAMSGHRFSAEHRANLCAAWARRRLMT